MLRTVSLLCTNTRDFHAKKQNAKLHFLIIEHSKSRHLTNCLESLLQFVSPHSCGKKFSHPTKTHDPLQDLKVKIKKTSHYFALKFLYYVNVAVESNANIKTRAYYAALRIFDLVLIQSLFL